MLNDWVVAIFGTIALLGILGAIWNFSHACSAIGDAARHWINLNPLPITDDEDGEQ